MNQYTIKVGRSGQIRRIIAETEDDAIFLAKHLGYVIEKCIVTGGYHATAVSTGVIIKGELVPHNIVALKRVAKIDELLEK